MPAHIHHAFSQYLLARDAVKLGRFVLNKEEPHQDYFDPSLEHPPEIIQSSQLNLFEFRHDDTEAQVSMLLNPVVEVSRGKHNQDHGAIGTAKSTIHQLGNSRFWFRSALQGQETRKWFEEAILEGEDIYLIVGYQIVRDARLNKEQSSSNGYAAKFQAPVAAALTAVGVVLPFGISADPGVGQSAAESHLAGGSHVAPGEQVSAIQYRKVKFKWYSSRNMDRAQLEKNGRWKMRWEFRGQDSGVNDVIEPQLSDDEGDTIGRQTDKDIGGAKDGDGDDEMDKNNDDKDGSSQYEG